HQPPRSLLIPYTTLFRSNTSNVFRYFRSHKNRCGIIYPLILILGYKVGVNLKNLIYFLLFMECIKFKIECKQKVGRYATGQRNTDRKSTRLNSSHVTTSY